VAVASLPSFVERDASLVLSSAGELAIARLKRPTKTAPDRTVELERLTAIGKILDFDTDGRHLCVVKSDRTPACFLVETTDGKARIDATKSLAVTGLKDVIGMGRSTLWCAWTKKLELSCWSMSSSANALAVRLGPTKQAQLSGLKRIWKGDPLTWLTGDDHVGRDKDSGLAAAWRDAELPSYPFADGPLEAVRTRENRCLVDRSGQVACWGDNRGQALGSTDRSQSEVPVRVKLPPEALASRGD
jgi:hypothetical protein